MVRRIEPMLDAQAEGVKGMLLDLGEPPSMTGLDRIRAELAERFSHVPAQDMADSAPEGCPDADEIVGVLRGNKAYANSILLGQGSASGESRPDSPLKAAPASARVMRAPSVGIEAQALGAAVRFASPLPESVKEAAICTVGAFGQTGVVELVTAVGYYCLISVTLNAFEIPLPDDWDDPFPD